MALVDNGTWVIVDLPPDKHALSCKWVFKYKFRADGTLERPKSRLVVCGNSQVEGEDYEETFAPVAKMTTVRTFLQIAASRNWEVHQMDVHNAFLHGDLKEEVYMRPPPGFKGSDKNKVCLLKKSLYGLKQAPRCWFEKLSSSLVSYGFTQSLSDYSLFIMERGAEYTQVLIYVDDLVVSASSSSLLASFKAYMNRCFHMKDLGISKYFLGLELARSPLGIYLCQRKYALGIIGETGLLAAKPVGFPVEQNQTLALDKGPDFADVAAYRRLIGRIIYLAVTRPDLAYSVHLLAQFMQKPKLAHWNAALRVVRYLKGNPGQGILLRANTDLKLSVWCDSDWSGCRTTRRSLTGWFITLGGSPISWKTQKQDCVSRSSCEAEYRAMSSTVQEVLWIRNLLRTFGITFTSPIPLHCDSKSAIYLAANPVFHERTKHVENDCHFIRDEIVKGVIATKHVSTHSQLADIFTKPLGRKGFDEFLPKLGVLDLHSPT